MVTKTTLASATSGLLLLAVVAMSGCTPRPQGPGPAAEKFFAALAIGDTASAAQLSDNPNEAREALNAAWAGLQAAHLDAQVLSAKYAETPVRSLIASAGICPRTESGPMTAS